jgi:hypothetical protein
MRRSLGALGVLVIAVSAWGGIVAYVGPTFDFDTGSTTTAWVWTQSHWTLMLTAGVVGIVGGILMMAPVGVAVARLGAALALVAGGWFVLGPTLAPLWQHGGITTSGSDGVSGSRTQRVLEGVGYHYGTGTVLMLLGALALVLLASVPAVVTEPVPDDVGETQVTSTRLDSEQLTPV